MSWATFDDLVDADAAYGFDVPFLGAPTGAITAAGANSGGVAVHVLPTLLGTTLWSTVKGVNLQSGFDATKDLRCLHLKNGSVRQLTFWLCRLNKIGVVDFTNTGQRLTHDACTYPLTRTRGRVSRNVFGFPLLHVTTATSTTAPIISSIGYKNQDGASVTGTQSFTLPATNTLVGTGLLLSLEDGDGGVQDITAVNVGTASSAGVADLYMAEPMLQSSVVVVGHVSQADMVRGSRFGPPCVSPATPTAGSLTSELAAIALGGQLTNTANLMARMVEQR